MFGVHCTLSYYKKLFCKAVDSVHVPYNCSYNRGKRSRRTIQVVVTIYILHYLTSKILLEPTQSVGQVVQNICYQHQESIRTVQLDCPSVKKTIQVLHFQSLLSILEPLITTIQIWLWPNSPAEPKRIRSGLIDNSSVNFGTLENHQQCQNLAKDEEKLYSEING